MCVDSLLDEVPDLPGRWSFDRRQHIAGQGAGKAARSASPVLHVAGLRGHAVRPHDAKGGVAKITGSSIEARLTRDTEIDVFSAVLAPSPVRCFTAPTVFASMLHCNKGCGRHDPGVRIAS